MLVQHVDACGNVHSKFYELFNGSLRISTSYNGTALAVSDRRRKMIRQAAFQLVENIKMILNLVILLRKKQLMMHLL